MMMTFSEGRKEGEEGREGGREGGRTCNPACAMPFPAMIDVRAVRGAILHRERKRTTLKERKGEGPKEELK